MTTASAVVLDHVRNPRNAGSLDGPGVAVGQARGGDGMDRVVLYARIVEERLEVVRFRASGCPALIAAASLFTERATGLSVARAAGLAASDLADALGLPAHQRAKAALVIEAFVEVRAKWDALEHERPQDPG